jgi:hypothetical protein
VYEEQLEKLVEQSGSGELISTSLPLFSRGTSMFSFDSRPDSKRYADASLCPQTMVYAVLEKAEAAVQSASISARIIASLLTGRLGYMGSAEQ